MEIRYIKRNEIDTKKWDACIARSVNGIVYAYSWYLDIVAIEWDALVGDDYKTVFPLVYGNKYGFNYLYQPPFAQQLGLFSMGPLSEKLLKRFTDLATQKFRYINIHLNPFLKVDTSTYKVIPHKVYHLDLIETYPKISGKFSAAIKKSISFAVAHGVQVVKGLSAFQILELKQKANPEALKRRHIEILTQLITTSVSNGTGELYGAYNETNELCSAALFLKSNGKLVFMLSATSDDGVRLNATHSIVDFVIRQYSEKRLVLDFEEAENGKTAEFYKGFGATECVYNQLIIDNLPANISLFK